LCPGLRAYGSGQGKAPKAPDGYVVAQPDTYWNAVDHQQRWKNADKNQVLITGMAGIEVDGQLRLLDSFFVPKDQLRVVCPVKESSGGYRPLSQAQIDAENRARAVQLEAARAAVGAFAGTPLEGRGYWPLRGYIEQSQKTTDNDRGEGMLVAIQLFVTNAEIEANLAEGERRVDEAAAAEAARLAAKQANAAAADAALQAKWSELCALDPAPEVLLTTGGDLWTKTPLGWTIEGQEEDVGYAEEFADLLEALNPAEVGGWWATQADYEADRPDATGHAGGGQ
jgi:ParB family chromosome partitioning protein